MEQIHTIIIKSSSRTSGSNILIAAIQVRILGSKGMLVRDDTLDDNCVILRKSMNKFNDKTIGEDRQVL